jgi:hypothetical protein
MMTAGIIVSGCGATSATLAAVLLLRLRPDDFGETWSGTALPRFVRAQRWPTVSAVLAAVLTLIGTVLLALA